MGEYEKEFGFMKIIESEAQISEESSPSEDSYISSAEFTVPLVKDKNTVDKAPNVVK